MSNREQVENARRLRREMTKEERRLWYEFLRGYPVRFMRQRPIGRFIVDFYCAKAKLVIEVDGSQHYETEGLAYDAERSEVLAARGIYVLRVPNNEVRQNFRAVCDQIDSEVRKRCRQGPLS